MYICGICDKSTEPRQSQLRYTYYRTVPKTEGKGTRREIAKEVPVCKECHCDLERGASIESLIALQEMHKEQIREKNKEVLPGWVNGSDIKRLPRNTTVVIDEDMNGELTGFLDRIDPSAN